jgi:hypothetical protein
VCCERFAAQVGDLEGTVTNLSETEPQVVRRPALMSGTCLCARWFFSTVSLSVFVRGIVPCAGFTDEIFGFAEWKESNPHKYGAVGSSHAHGAVTNIWAEPTRDHDRGLPPALRPRTAEPALDASGFGGFFDSFGAGTQESTLPKASTLTHSLDGKLIQTSGSGKNIISPPATAMSRAASTLNPKSKRLPRI